jgi:drug/metabolite transporter (DMT)-like permease
MAEKKKIWHWLVIALLSLIWGTSYILMKKGLESFSSLQIGSLRIFITFLCLLPVAIRNLNKLTLRNSFSISLIGLFGSGIPAFLFPLAQTKVSSSAAGMLNSLSPVFTMVVGVLFYRRKAIPNQIAGIILGLIGAVGLIYNGSLSLNYYGLFVVLATILYGISTNEVALIKDMNGLQVTSLAFLIISPIAIIYLLFADFSTAMATTHWLRNLGCIILLAVMGSACALALFYLLVMDTSPVFGSMVTYFIPIISTLWGLSDNENITSSMLISVAFIFAGVYMINRTRMMEIRRSRNE